MDIVLWVAQGLLALAFFGAGFTKLKDSREVYAAQRPPMTSYATRMPVWLYKAVGAAEVAAALGLVLPWALDIAPVLTPIAATGLVVIMVGAFVDHARHGERQSLPVNVVLGALAAFVALGRFLGW
ncbi:DoxX family protein [Demequina sp. NBRC 110056]|uniref:DoxX family protein n=1 Tax=Demequina sp. NBRC 110056 TaxID=1570345 RepID=UPI000A061592|nr:DoxX family protein [Demequina sp. NBRC 110056]